MFSLPEILAKLADPDPDREAPGDPELRDLFDRDQDDRRDGVPGDGGERGLARRARCMEKFAAGEVRSPGDYYHLAAVMQHGGLAEHYHLAFELARRAADAGCRPARRLAASALDRWLMQMGLPQRYGTQYVDIGGRWSLYRVDPVTTDAERTVWDVPPLAEALAQAEEMNHADGLG
ncbi:hypothetical protein ACFYUV_40265 [Nonomuraea sp. NPDC003560]|uniref:hypothetical protein n=1 Tax=Nonomuraea sp. NPDC003560 TaxID=3364341 RepID=UPI00367E548E